jgi:FkbM family methyltransferase
MDLFPGDSLSDSIAFTGLYEHDLSRRVAELGRKGGMMVDVGANLGYFSLLWASSRFGNKSIAIEASPRNLDLLLRNVVLNGFDKQIQIVPCAAGRASGNAQFSLGPEEQRGWGGLALAPGADCVEVKMIRLDETIPTASQIDLLKIDTEGADAWVLMGCERLLKASVVSQADHLLLRAV